jgi:hypothetical protein
VSVYIVFLTDYENTRNLGVFDTKEKAVDFIETLPYVDRVNSTIEEHAVL